MSDSMDNDAIEPEDVINTDHFNHPYFPRDLNLPGYVPMVVDFVYILGVFFAAVLAVFTATWFVSGKYKYLTYSERALSSWLMVTGLIHFIIEGWVVIVADFYTDTSGNYLSDTWKEYSKADSRYASRDSFIISMEAVTAFAWGPLCPLAAWAIMTHKPWRWALVLIVSLGQLYGDVLYFGTCYLEGFVHSRPEWMYFWFYFVIVNGIWIVIPVVVIVVCVRRISQAVEAAEGSSSLSAVRAGYTSATHSRTKRS